VVLSAGNGVLRLDGSKEVAKGQFHRHSTRVQANSPGDELGALVDELVEGVLAVGPGLSPNNRLQMSA
jgi:hypothetical protein